MKVTIVQCTPTGFMPLAWLIRLVQWTNYSHYAIKFETMLNTVVYLDVTYKNVSLSTKEAFESHYVITKEYEMQVNYPKEYVIRWVEAYLGTPYAFLSLLGIPLKIKGIGSKDERMTCNELVLRFLNRFFGANIKDIDLKDLNQTEAHLEELQPRKKK